MSYSYHVDREQSHVSFNFPLLNSCPDVSIPRKFLAFTLNLLLLIYLWSFEPILTIPAVCCLIENGRPSRPLSIVSWLSTPQWCVISGRQCPFNHVQSNLLSLKCDRAGGKFKFVNLNIPCVIISHNNFSFQYVIPYRPQRNLLMLCQLENSLTRKGRGPTLLKTFHPWLYNFSVKLCFKKTWGAKSSHWPGLSLVCGLSEPLKDWVRSFPPQSNLCPRTIEWNVPLAWIHSFFVVGKPG